MKVKKKSKKVKKLIPILDEDLDLYLNRLRVEEQEIIKSYEASFKDYKQSSLFSKEED